MERMGGRVCEECYVALCPVFRHTGPKSRPVRHARADFPHFLDNLPPQTLAISSRFV